MATPGVSRGQADPNAPETNRIEILEACGPIQILTARSTDWVFTTPGQFLKVNDRFRTGPKSRALLRWSGRSIVPVGPSTELEVRPPAKPRSLFGMKLLRGIISFFHGDEPGQLQLSTRGIDAGVDGTEFVLEVDQTGPTELTRLSVVDGRVHVFNALGRQELTNNQESVTILGQPPSPPVGFNANNRLQWCFYYPGILDLRDLPLSAAEEAALESSLRAYRQGDLLAALRLYPAVRTRVSDAERLYHAALLLSVGQVSQTEAELALLPPALSTDRIPRLATALRVLIAAVKRDPNPSTVAPQLSTELLAASYYEQSLAVREKSLESALRLAREAAATSPDFGFAWERVAELEFSFGRIEQAEQAFEKSFALSPRNAEALALEGFLLAAQNKTRDAIQWFNYAIEADPSLGNAWLGRGLCRIHKGDLPGGSEDLLVATALEPQRALLRSYLGKAYADKGDYARATKELRRAKYIDPLDPTAWLYSALLDQQENRINDAVHDLERSQGLNDDRSVYRSRLLLDQDRAVRSANLAAIYRDAGMIDLSAREASRAVSYDYANYSAHLFLANSFDQLRDPNRINLRYETPADSEYLIANLLAPIQAGSLSPAISQQEYSRLFERDGFGLSSSTEYLSRGAWSQAGAQYGVFGDTSYDFEALYHSDPGQRPNNDFTEKGFSFQVKQQVSPRDTVFLQGSYYDAAGGDLAQYYAQTDANPGLRTFEKQNPILLAGYHHEWSPGVHTLLLAGRLTDIFNVDNPLQRTFYVGSVPPIGINLVHPFHIPQEYRSSVEIYTAELQQLWQTPLQTTVIGGRFQTGNFETKNIQTFPLVSDNLTGVFNPNHNAADQDETTDLERFTFYAYHSHRFFERLQLTAGLAYDRLTFPENFRAAPISGADKTVDQLGPKVGLVWTPFDGTAIRADYTRSLGGAGFDQSLRLEPSTVAGFLQSFRSIIPESVGGAEAGAEFETFGLSVEQHFPTGTYLGVSVERLHSTVHRVVGVFVANPPNPLLGSIDEHLDYSEKALVLTVDQLVGAQFSVGVRYRVSDADLGDRFPSISPSLPPEHLFGFLPDKNTGATLQQLNLYAVFNHPSGLFAQVEGIFSAQSNRGYSPPPPDSDFWQVNLYAGYRFLQRRAELTLGLLNLGDQNYQLNPLTLYNDLPRGRTLSLRLSLNF
ncbi:MAG TPA: TonB-dependent receptor [Verrucomicrobiae bacterium]|nr:TonB-dependent receptor [Verrucomicrobiae bacterium]